MFTGIIEEKGLVEALEKKKNLFVLQLSSCRVSQGTRIGDSIAIDGVCLTVVEIQKPHYLFFEIMKETIQTTTFQDLTPGCWVNLERALKANSSVGGHFVSGHVDGVGTIRKILKKENYVEFRIFLNKKFRRFLARKGSVAVDGVSLTVGELKAQFFSVQLIPYTLKTTTLGIKKEGQRVNIETDLLAKYVLQKGN